MKNARSENYFFTGTGRGSVAAKLIEKRRRKLWRLLFAWHRDARRVLPWRNTEDPYRILISEIMLQQTQVNHVAAKYRGFLKRFPTITSLTSASAGEVIRAWSGLGYNTRALRLREIAQRVRKNFRGKIPEDPDILRKLPGIGRYTANAIACFAFRRHVPVVDTNVRRVISRLFFRMHSPEDRIPEKSAWEIARILLPENRARDWTFALMDLGSTICTARRLICKECPVNDVCASAFRVIQGGQHRRRSTKEPSYKGTPHRIYRGRVVEILRRIDERNPVTLRELGSRIKSPFTRSEEPWLQSLLKRLEHDGLVRIITDRSRTVRVSLP